jgi:hypothetical protein
MAGSLDLHLHAPLRARHGMRLRWPHRGRAEEVLAAISTTATKAVPAGIMAVAARTEPVASLCHGLELDVS